MTDKQKIEIYELALKEIVWADPVATAPSFFQGQARQALERTGALRSPLA